MTLSAVTLRATPARVYLVLELLSSVNSGTSADRKAVYKYCDKSGYLEGKHAKRMKFRDALDRLVALGLVDRLPDDRLAISRDTPRPQMPEFALWTEDNRSTHLPGVFADSVFRLREAGLVEAVPPTTCAGEIAWRRTAKGLACELASGTAGMSATELS